MEFSAILAFIHERRLNGAYNYRVFHSGLTACRAVISVLAKDEDSAHFVDQHLPELIARYARLRPELTDQTLGDYRRRARRALADYLGRPPSRQRRRVPILATKDPSTSNRPAAPDPPYPQGEWVGTGGVWWSSVRRSSPKAHPALTLPRWLADNRSAVRWEVADAAAQSPRQRLQALRRACATGVELLKLNSHPQRVLDWVDPLPESSRAAWARLRTEHRRRS